MLLFELCAELELEAPFAPALLELADEFAAFWMTAATLAAGVVGVVERETKALKLIVPDEDVTSFKLAFLFAPAEAFMLALMLDIILAN